MVAMDAKAPFIVNAYSEPVEVKVRGRVSYLNAMPLSHFFDYMLKQGKRHFSIDFEDCLGVDSTFLGILAGLAIELRRCEPKGVCRVFHLSPRNLDLMRHVGLHKMVEIEEVVPEQSLSGKAVGQELVASGEVTKSHLKEVVRSAHENLIRIDEQNKKRFQDVVSFLKNQSA